MQQHRQSRGNPGEYLYLVLNEYFSWGASEKDGIEMRAVNQ